MPARPNPLVNFAQALLFFGLFLLMFFVFVVMLTGSFGFLFCAALLTIPLALAAIPAGLLWLMIFGDRNSDAGTADLLRELRARRRPLPGPNPTATDDDSTGGERPDGVSMPQPRPRTMW